MATESRGALRIALQVLFDLGLGALVPYVRILNNPGVKWALRLLIGKLLDSHLGRAAEANEAVDHAKALGQRPLQNPEARDRLKKVIYYNRDRV